MIDMNRMVVAQETLLLVLALALYHSIVQTRDQNACMCIFRPGGTEIVNSRVANGHLPDGDLFVNSFA